MEQRVGLQLVSQIDSSVKLGMVVTRPLFGVLVLGALLFGAAPAQASDHSVLIKMLEDGNSFRVRARAAMALGRTKDGSAVGALERGLSDPHAAVRAACATALGRVGTASSVPRLRSATSDQSPRVVEQAKIALRMIATRDSLARGSSATPAAVVATPRESRLEGARFAVVLGEVRNRSGFQGRDLALLVHDRMFYELDQMPQVAVFKLAEMDGRLLRQIRARKIHIFRVEGNLTTIEATLSSAGHRVRAEVSLLLLDEPERILRSMLRGAATGMEEPRGPEASQRRLLARQAITGAVRSAVTNAKRAIEAASIKRDLGMGGDIRAEASLSHPVRRR
jgi:hypothetical protein